MKKAVLRKHLEFMEELEKNLYKEQIKRIEKDLESKKKTSKPKKGDK